MKKSIPITEKQYQAFVRKARAELAEMAADERSMGFIAPEDDTLFGHIRTILFALDAAIRTRDWTIVGHGLVMTRDVLKRMEPALDDFNMTPQERRFVEHLLTRRQSPPHEERGH